MRSILLMVEVKKSGKLLAKFKNYQKITGWYVKILQNNLI